MRVIFIGNLELKRVELGDIFQLEFFGPIMTSRREGLCNLKIHIGDC